MKIKKGDKISIIKGEDRGKSGKIIKAIPQKYKVIIEGLNLIKKTVKPKKQGEHGQVVKIPSPISVANIKLICRVCGKITRVGFRLVGLKKERYCKKCKAIN